VENNETNRYSSLLERLPSLYIAVKLLFEENHRTI
jgi:hypothetical protein